MHFMSFFMSHWFNVEVSCLNSHPERHLQVPPSSKQDSGSGEYVSPLMSTDNHCNSVPPGATFQQNWPAAGSTLVNSAQGG